MVTPMRYLSTRLLAPALLIASLAAVVRASEAWPVQVYQPFDMPDGIAVMGVSYVTWGGVIGIMTMVCWPMRISGGGGHVENAAASAHLSVRERNDWDGDTLWVDLDARKYRFEGLASGQDDSLVLIRATLECLKATAGSDDSMRYLRVRVLGAPVYRALGGVFSLTDYRCGPRVRQF